MCNRLFRILSCVLALSLAAVVAALSQGMPPNQATLPTVNGVPFTSGPVEADSAHCGWNYVLGGASFYVASVPGGTSFPEGCTIHITNIDVTACKGKSIHVAGFHDNFVLWPGQSVALTRIEDSWLQTVAPGRWRPNCGGNPMVINTDSTKGTDIRGASDGLGLETEAFKTVNFALQYVLTDFDFAGAPQTRVRILMAAGSTDSSVVHYAPHSSNPGSQGGAALTIDGNGGVLTAQSDFLFDAIVQIRNVTFTNPSGTCLNVQQLAYVLLSDQITFGYCKDRQINVGLYGQVEFFNDFTISDGGGSFISNAGGMIYPSEGVTAKISKNITYTDEVVAGQLQGWTHLAQIAWSLGGNTVTGKKYSVATGHILTGATNIPGSEAGITTSGGQAY
jgi:hypothetical protein